MTIYNPEPEIDAEVRMYFESVFGRAQFNRILKQLCIPSLKTTLRVNTTVTNSQEVLEELDCLQSFHPHRHPVLNNVVVLQGIGPQEVSVPADLQLKEILISRKTAESVLRGASVYAPGVLAATSGLASNDFVAIYASNEKEGITRGSLLQVEKCKNDQLLFIGIGICQMSRTELFRSHSGLAVTLSEPIFKSPPCNGLLTGKVMLQNLPSIVTAHVLNPKPGWKVLDMCAAPGGKTTAMAEIMRDQGMVIALDRTHKKAKQIIDLAEELKLTCISAYKMDATKVLFNEQISTTDSCQKEMNSKELARKQRKESFRLVCKQEPLSKAAVMSECKGLPCDFFDAVLLDAPCSALGLRPRLNFPQTFSELKETATYQRRLLDVAVSILKEDGVLVYSTCTINPLENEGNVRYVLDHYPCMELKPQDPYLGTPGLQLSADGKERWLTSEEASLVQRFDPCDIDLDTIGFFIAKFTKRTHIKHYSNHSIHSMY